MTDPLSLLAPPVGPVGPEVVVASASPGIAPALWIAGVALLAVVVLAVAALAWWRRRWSRALARVRGAAPPGAAAECLAQAARRRAVRAPAAWWQALDSIRFGRPAPAHAALLKRLLAEAEAFEPQDRLIWMPAWRAPAPSDA